MGKQNQENSTGKLEKMDEKEKSSVTNKESLAKIPKKLVVSSSPHLRALDDTRTVMLTVIVALIPIAVYDIYLFGWYAVKTFFWSIFGALLAEAGIQRMRKMKVTIDDGSALLTGILFAMCMPPKVPFWLSFIGGFVSISLGKQIYGGLGHNIFNPALVGRAFVLISWAKHLTQDWYKTVDVDTISGATPLFVAKQFYEGAVDVDLSQFYEVSLFRNPYGSMGEVSVLLVLVGFAILLYKKVIDWTIPVSYLGTLFLFTWLVGRDPTFYILTGGAFFGAVFMATDYVTSPITKRGRLIFGFGCGFLTFLLRIYSNAPEAVAYSILFMNALTPLIDTYTMPKKFGAVKET